MPPAQWKSTKLKVLFKKGDPHAPQNYRPISIIPVLSKLFSTILYARMVEMIDAQLSEEQFGFRRGRGCADAVHVLRTIVEKSSEWGEELWIAALDVEKAFDRVHHSALFGCLIACRMDMDIVAALWNLYQGMSGYVTLWPGADSRLFAVERGVRQGDPLSPLLFNLVLDSALREVGAVWQRRGYGTNVGQTLRGYRITHVAFADDQTLIARSWLSMRRMIFLHRNALRPRGLSLHPSKCKVQTNRTDWTQRGNVAIEEGFSVDILAQTAPLRILGTDVSLIEVTGSEIANRIAAAGRMFWSMKGTLLNAKASLKCRLRLFDRTVSSCALWCAESWTPRRIELAQLRTAQQSMLRRIVGKCRCPDEQWIEWIKRTTTTARSLAKSHKVRDWVVTHHRKKWSWAGHVAR